MLANRIALLKQEEAKAWKKIQQTKIRAEEVLRLREENRRRGQEAKSIIAKQKKEERKRLMEKLNQREAASKALAEREYKAKRRAVAEMKRQKAIVAKEKQEVFSDMLDIAKSRVSKIKRDKRIASENRKIREQAIIERNKKKNRCKNTWKPIKQFSHNCEPIKFGLVVFHLDSEFITNSFSFLCCQKFGS